MPKLKTRKAVAKRVSVTGTGKIKSTKRKRSLRQSTLVDSTNVKAMKKELPYI